MLLVFSLYLKPLDFFLPFFSPKLPLFIEVGTLGAQAKIVAWRSSLKQMEESWHLMSSW